MQSAKSIFSIAGGRWTEAISISRPFCRMRANNRTGFYVVVVMVVQRTICNVLSCHIHPKFRVCPCCSLLHPSTRSVNSPLCQTIYCRLDFFISACRWFWSIAIQSSRTFFIKNCVIYDSQFVQKYCTFVSFQYYILRKLKSVRI